MKGDGKIYHLKFKPSSDEPLEENPPNVQDKRSKREPVLLALNQYVEGEADSEDLDEESKSLKLFSLTIQFANKKEEQVLKKAFFLVVGKYLVRKKYDSQFVEFV